MKSPEAPAPKAKTPEPEPEPEPEPDLSVAEQNAGDGAQSYLNYSGSSFDGLVDQLMFEGYTREQARYGAKKAGL